MTEKLSHNGLVHAEDLFFMLGANNDIKLLDATYAMPGGQMSPEQGFLTRRIDGAQFFDIDAIADQSALLPHTLPSPDYFASCVAALGISNADHVVIYDQSGSYMASSRAWWMFRVFGHENVYVLEGGIQAWLAGGYKVVNGPADAPAMGNFKAGFRPDLVVSRNDLLVNIETKDMQVVDARPPARFKGDIAEPRPGMRSGHIPGSKNLPFAELLERVTVSSRGGAEPVAHLKAENDLGEAFAELGIGREDRVAMTCGSGVTACTLALALYKLRGQDAAIYDGSWSEWGDVANDTPIELSA